MERFQDYLTEFTDSFISFIPNILLSVFILVVGFWIVRRLLKMTRQAFEKSGFAADISSFLISILDIGLKIVVLLSAAVVLGFQVASLLAVLAAAGFAIGLALQGSLGNFAAGIIILVSKPYKVGDWIEVKEKFGKVSEIHIFNTIMISPGQKTLIIPNGQVIEDVVTNYSAKGVIRLELNVSMPYEESFPKVKTIIEEVVLATPNVLSDPAPEIGIESYDSHNIVLSIRPYVKPDDYWEVTFEVYQRIKQAFNQHNIKMAYSEGVELGTIGS